MQEKEVIRDGAISFMVYESDPPLQIQLEPEAFALTVNPNETVAFKALNPSEEFSWCVRYGEIGLQLFPDTYGTYDKIEVYRNGKISTEFDFIWE
jgi:hypothetical protein